MIGLLLAAAAALQPVAATPVQRIAATPRAPAAPAKPATVEFWVLDQISFPNTQDAAFQETVKSLEPDHTMDAVATRLALRGIKFERTIVTVDTTKMPPDMLAQLKALPPTEPFAIPVPGRMTINGILSKRTGPAGPGAAAPPTPAPSADAAASIDRLIDAMDLASQLDTQIGRTVDMMVAAMPANSGPRAEEARKIIAEEVRASLLKSRPLLVIRARELYLARFSTAELNQLVAFYASPVGRKLTSMAPGIAAEMTQFGQRTGLAAAKEAQPRILERLRAANIQVPQGT